MTENATKKTQSMNFYTKYRQQILYFLFAALMMGLNYIIQWLNLVFISQFISENFGHLTFIQ
ncbi:MAG: hypothetical protein ACTSWY_09150, partial [Promethearchaeota archaeon]